MSPGSKEWRKQWERESAQAHYDKAHARDRALAAVFDEEHRRWFLAMGPRARAAYRAFRLADREERAGGMEWMTAPGARKAEAAAEEEYRKEYAFGTGQDRRSRLHRLAETFVTMVDAWVEREAAERKALPGPGG